MPDVGSGVVPIKPDHSGFSRDLTRGVNDSIDGSSSALKQSFAKIGKVAAVALAGVGVAGAGFLTKAISSASDLNETLSKVGVVFGDQQKIVADFANKMAKDFGTPKREILDAAASIGLIGKASGLSEKDAAKMSTRLASLAADASSFYNVPLPEALQAIQSGLVGEAEPMRRFGVLLNEDAVKAEALRLGLVKTAADTGKMSAAAEKVSIAQLKAAEASKKFGADSAQARTAALAVTTAQDALAEASKGVKVELTEGQKAQARASLITRGMADATGDLERTQGSLANRLKEVRGRAENFAADIGTKLLPVVLDAFDVFEKWGGILQSKFAPIIRTVGLSVQALFAAFREGDVTSDGLVGVFERIGNATRTLVLGLRALFAAFREGDVTSDGFVGVMEHIGVALRAVFKFVKANAAPLLAALGAVIVTVVVPAFVAWASAALAAAAAQLAAAAPVIALVAALATLAAGVVYAYEHFEDFRRVVNGVAKFLTGTVAPGFKAVASAVIDALGAAVDWVKDVWPQVSEVVSHVVNVVAGIIRTFVDVVSAMWRAWGDDIFGVVKRTFESLRETVNNALQIISGLFKFVIAIINGDWGKAWDALKSVVSAAWDQVKNIVTSAIAAIRSLLGGVVSIFAEVFRPLGNFLHTWIVTPFEAVVSFIAGLPAQITKASVGMFDGIKNAFRSAINFIIKGWNSLDFTLPGFDPPGPGPKLPSFTLGVPDIPLLAKGGTLRAGQLGIVGDGGGPELIRGGVGGSRVFPHEDLIKALGSSGGGGLNIEKVEVNGTREVDPVSMIAMRLRSEMFLVGG